MKHKGSKFECEKERNDDLMRNYHLLLDQSVHISMPDIYREVVERPSSRFWVSEERAAIVVASMLRGDDLGKMISNKKEMFREICSRVVKLRSEHPNMTVYEACFRVVRQPAPKFYLTPGSAKVIICKAKEKWYKERKRRLRHLL